MTDPAPHDPPLNPLRLTPSVHAAMKELPDASTPAAIVAALLRVHPEYANGLGRSMVLDAQLGPPLAVVEWLARVQASIADDRDKLHGRVVIAGLARLDPTLREQLQAQGFLSALEEEIHEPLEQIFGDAPPPPAPPRERVAATAADVPTPKDRLGFTPLVSALRALLDDENTALPLTVAVTGKWGAGKSSVMRQLEQQLREPPPGVTPNRRWTTVRFDAWKYERSERLWAAMAKAIYDQALEQRKGIAARLRFRVRLEWVRLGLWRFLLRFAWPLLVAAAAVIALAAADLGPGGRAAGTLGLIAASCAVVAQYWKAVADPFKRAVERHASHPDYEQFLGFTSEADHDIACLTRTVTSGDDDALVVFVDDLDRCSSAHLVEVVEAISQIFNSDERRRRGADRCAFVLGLDREIVATSIEAAYAETIGRLERAKSPLAPDFGFQFLGKIVQLSVGVPQPSRDRLRALLTEGTPAPTDNAAAAALLEDVRQSPEVDTAELTAVDWLELNPRQAKRFHNIFRLQVYVAAGGDVRFDDEQLLGLARWVALRLRWPALADDLDQEPTLLKLLDTVANEEKVPETDWTDEERRLLKEYETWFVHGKVLSVLLEAKGSMSSRTSELPLDRFLPVA